MSNQVECLFFRIRQVFTRSKTKEPVGRKEGAHRSFVTFYTRHASRTHRATASRRRRVRAGIGSAGNQ